MRVSLYNIIGCGQSRGSQKMAKTRAVLTKGIGDRLGKSGVASMFRSEDGGRVSTFDIARGAS